MLANEPDEYILYLYHLHKIAHWQAGFLMAPLLPLTLLKPSARLVTGSSDQTQPGEIASGSISALLVNMASFS